MLNDFRIIAYVALLGILLVTIRHWGFVRELWWKATNWLKIKFKKGSLTQPPKNRRPRPLLNRLLEYFITICVAFISFYSAYLLNINKSNDETKRRAINLLELAKNKCIEIEYILTDYIFPDSTKHGAQQPSDSLIISEYYKRSVRQPFYITENIPPYQVLSYISQKGYDVLASMENNEQMAMMIVHDSTITYFNRHKTLNAVLKFDSLRERLIEAEEANIDHDGRDSSILYKLQDSLNQCDTRFALTLSPKAYNYYFKDSIEQAANLNIPWEAQDSLKKYSYLLTGDINGNLNGSATCFFIRKNNHLYLVGTYGTFTSWNVLDNLSKGSRFSPFPDTLALRLFRRIDGRARYVPIPIAKIKDTSKMRHYWDKPDLFFYKMDDASLETNYQIYSVERFIECYNFEYGTPYQIFYAGVPSAMLGSPESFWTMIPTVYKTGMVGDIKEILIYPDIRKVDSINYLINDSPRRGIDGAPLFFRISIPDGAQNIDLITFGGMYFVTTADHRGRVVRPEEFIKQLRLLR
jgi:hypothetical protein